MLLLFVARGRSGGRNNIVETPVEVSPLAVADAISTPEADRFLYELIFPNRIGLLFCKNCVADFSELASLFFPGHGM